MDTVTMKLYEGLFLVNSAEAAADWDATVAVIERVLERAGAEVLSLAKWDERKLAFELRGMSRGTFLLSYFKCDPLKIAGIERDVQLSEQIVRVLVLTTDKMSEEDIAKATPVAAAEQKVAAAAKAAEEAEAAKVAEAAAKAEEAAAKEAAASEEATEVVVEEAPAAEGETTEQAETEETTDQA